MRRAVIATVLFLSAVVPTGGDAAPTFTAAPGAVVLSQIYGGGGNRGAPLAASYVELFNRSSAPVDLSSWSVQYSSASGTTWQVTTLSGTIQPDSYYLVAERGGADGVALPRPDAIGTISMNAVSGKVALVSTTSALTGNCPIASAFVSDFVGYGSATCYEGASATGALSNSRAALRFGGGDVDTDDNAADFLVDAPEPHNSQGIPPFGNGSIAPQSVPPGGSALLTVLVTPGARPANTDIRVSGDLSPIGGGTTVLFFDDGTHGDRVAHDNVFSLTTTVTGAPGIKTLRLSVSDGVPRSTQTTIVLAAETTTTPIHDIQGPGSTSPLADKYVTTRGIVTAVKFNGVFIQTRDGEADADDRTSEGIFIFTGVTPPAFLSTGEEVFASGTVHEFVPPGDPASPPVTELGNAFFRVTSSGEPLPDPMILLPSYTDPDGNFEQLERFEGMRVAANVVAVSPTEGHVDEANATSSSNGVFYAVIPGVARPVREPGIEPTQTLPPDAPPHIPRFDGNPERLRIDSDALVDSPRIDIVAGQVITGITGPLDYVSRSYTILPDPARVAGHAWTPIGNARAVPVPIPSPQEFTVGHYNLERFFDDVDDPLLAPDNEPVLTHAALNGRLAKASLAIRHVLRFPDILGVIEVENLSVLKRIGRQVSADAIRDGEDDPQYQALLEEGNDVGGIDVGFLVKRAAGRVRIVNVTQVGKETTYTPPDGGALLLNDRPPLVLEAVVTSAAGVECPVTVIVNHLRSLRGIDGDDGPRIRVKRRAQAEFVANYIQARQSAHPDERIVSIGDYNAFPFNDGYVDVMGAIEGRPAPADQVVLASADLVNPDLTNAVDLIRAGERYSFSFDGNAQALDHILMNDPARRRFTRMAYARLDADFPESFRGDVTRPERLSDHDAAVAYFAFPVATATRSLVTPKRSHAPKR